MSIESWGWIFGSTKRMRRTNRRSAYYHHPRKNQHRQPAISHSGPHLSEIHNGVRLIAPVRNTQCFKINMPTRNSVPQINSIQLFLIVDLNAHLVYIFKTIRCPQDNSLRLPAFTKINAMVFLCNPQSPSSIRQIYWNRRRVDCERSRQQPRPSFHLLSLLCPSVSSTTISISVVIVPLVETPTTWLFNTSTWGIQW